MSVKSAPYYWLECDHDGCTRKSTEGSEHTAWSDVNGALDDAEGGDWYAPTTEGKHYCDQHHLRNEDEGDES